MTDVNADAAEDFVVEGPIETPEPESKPTAEAPEAPESSAEEGQPEAGWEKRVAKLTHAKRRAEAKIREQEELLKKYVPTDDMGAVEKPLPEVPQMPDPDMRYDNPEEYARKIRDREDAIERRAEVKAANKLAKTQAEANQNTVATKHQEQIKSIVGKYTERGAEAGLSEDRMQYNEIVLQEAGIGADLGRYLYEDELGPRIVNYLAENPSVLDKVAEMSPVRAAEYIALSVKPKIGKSKPKTTGAPDPVKPAKGAGVPDRDPWDLLPNGYVIT